LAARFISWAAQKITRRIDADVQESDQLVRSESAKYHQAVASVISWVSIAVLFMIVAVQVTDILQIPVAERMIAYTSMWNGVYDGEVLFGLPPIGGSPWTRTSARRELSCGHRLSPPQQRCTVRILTARCLRAKHAAVSTWWSLRWPLI